MKIYTKTGDKGETGLFGGARVMKDSQRIEAFGSVDELNAVIGIVLSLSVPEMLLPMLTKIQSELFIMGADLASPGAKAIERVDIAQSTELERFIDEMELILPHLRSFILPGGTHAASQLHFARTVCRRAERNVVHLSHTEQVSSAVIIYLNRLSDFLFVAARFANHEAHETERPWISNTITRNDLK